MLTHISCRMFREPEPEHKTHTINLDPTGHARTPIRRHRTREHQAALQRRIGHEEQRRTRVNARADRQALYDSLHEDRERDNDHARRRETRNAWATNGSSRDRYLEDMNRRRLESGRNLLMESLNYERPGQRMRLPRESALRYEMSAATSPPPDIRDRLQTDPTSIPFSRSFPDFEAWRSASQHNERQSSYQSQRFAPAYRLTDSPPENSRSPRPEVARLSSATPIPRDGNEHPRTRTRAGRASSIADMVVNHTDGLGDRRRSFSPEESTWSTLFSTITPDEHLPSAESSFTSATASAASSLSPHSGSSSSTLLTAPSTNAATINALSHVCDDPSETSGSDTEDDFPLGDYAGALSGDGPTDEDDDAGRTEESNSRHVQDREERASSRRWRLGSTAEIRHLHAIHDRLERQLPIPHDWWASAGLSPNLGMRTERAERGRL